MGVATAPEQLTVSAGGLDLAVLAWGVPGDPLALCLHGYPDSAWTWRHLGPFLAGLGWRVAAPFMRGYAPSPLAPDGAYQVGALARDAVALADALGADGRAVLIGHDWGAAAVYAAGGAAPERFRRLVTLAVPPGPVLLSPLSSPRRAVADAPLIARQLRMSWYMFFQLLPGVSERALDRLIPRLWSDWSPGYDAGEDLPRVLAALGEPEHRTAALRYYRALFLPWMRRPEYAREQRHLFRVPPVPLLYLHGERDGCMNATVARRAEAMLEPPSRFELVPGAGHFLHLERPREVGESIAVFIAA